MKKEIKVIVFVLAVLLVAEVAVRVFENRFSVDIAHVNSIPSVAESVKSDEGTSVLFVGNSLTRHGVNDDLFKSLTAENGVFDGAPETHFVYPDGGSITPWLLAYQNEFARKEIAPDVLLVMFGRAHLQDLENDPSTLSTYAGFRDIPEMLTGDRISGVEGKTQFMLSEFSAAHAHRNRVQPRLFTAIIPHYQESLRHMNDVRNARILRTVKEEEINEPTFRELERFLKIADPSAAGRKVVLVSMPMLKPYNVPGEAVKMIKKSGALFLDLKDIAGLTEENYPDNYHLDEAGADVFTRALCDALAEQLKEK